MLHSSPLYDSMALGIKPFQFFSSGAGVCVGGEGAAGGGGGGRGGGNSGGDEAAIKGNVGLF